MASIRKELVTKASAGNVWGALRDVGALHTRLVPGYVADTRLEPGVRIVTFADGRVVREPILDVSDAWMRVAWTAESKLVSHYNASAQVLPGDGPKTKVVWILDFLPDDASAVIDGLMNQAMAAMQKALDALAPRP